MANNQQQRPRPLTLQEQSLLKEDKDHSKLHKGIIPFLMFIFVLNLLNVALYNTGWVKYEIQNEWDAGWGTFIAVMDVVGIFMLSLFQKK
jgi:hypothetical protein